MKQILFIISIIFSVCAVAQPNQSSPGTKTGTTVDYLGDMRVPDITSAVGTKAVRWDGTNKKFSLADTSIIGGGGAHGNYGAIQVGRNGLHQGTDSFLLDASTNLKMYIKGAIQFDGAWGFSDFPAGSISQTASYGTLFYVKTGSVFNWGIRNAAGDFLIYTYAGTTDINFSGSLGLGTGKYLWFDDIGAGDKIGRPSNDLINTYINNTARLGVHGSGVDVTGTLKVNDGTAVAGYVFTSTDGSGTGTWTPKAGVVSSADFTGQTGTTTITTYTTPNNGIVGVYNISAHINVTAVTGGVLTTTVTYSDETAASRTVSFFGMGLTSAGISATGVSNFAVMGELLCYPNTTITVTTTLTVGTATYNCGATVIFVRDGYGL